MRVFFDTTPLQDQRGIGRWAAGTLAALRSVCEVVEMPAAPLDPFDAAREPDCYGRYITHYRGSNVCNIAFFPSVHWVTKPAPPLFVVGVLDVIPLLYPDLSEEKYVAPWRPGGRYWTVAGLAKAVLTISEASKRDIVVHLGIDPERVHVVPMGVQAPAFGRAWRPPGTYFVAIGTDRHKNIRMLLDAVPHGTTLVVIGHRPPEATSWPQEGVIWKGRLSDAEVGPLLRSAAALVWPSQYEGLGLPPLEALLAGVPVISSDRPAMNEALRGYVRLVPHDNPVAWHDAMADAARRPAELRRMAAEGRRMVRSRYTWDNCAAHLEPILYGIFEEPGIPRLPA